MKSLHAEICLMGREAVILRICLKCIYSESVNLFLLCMQIQVNHRQNLQSAQLVFLNLARLLATMHQWCCEKMKN